MTIDRILAATHAINMMAVDLQMVTSETVLMGKPLALTSDNMAELQRTAKALKKIVENLGNYIDSHDVQNEDTLKALNALLDIVYERNEG